MNNPLPSFVIRSLDNNYSELLPRSCTHKLNRVKVMQVKHKIILVDTKIDPIALWDRVYGRPKHQGEKKRVLGIIVCTRDIKQ